jgi:hypothetical protein
MSEAKHTPGPWIWGDDYRGLYGAGPDNEVLCHASYEGMWLSHKPNREADARLIAAAPELLDELQKAHQIILNALALMTLEQKSEWARANSRDGCIGDGTTRYHERAEAIAKAGGAAC